MYIIIIALKNKQEIALKIKSQIKGSKERQLLGQWHSMPIFGVITFIKLQNDTWTTVKRKNDEKN